MIRFIQIHSANIKFLVGYDYFLQKFDGHDVFLMKNLKIGPSRFNRYT
jgi:hypothetical protein